MADMQFSVADIEDKGFYGLMEDKQVKAVATPNPSLQVSVSFGRFDNDSLSWEKFSAFSPNKYLEEVGKCATPGSVAQKKAYFEAHYKKIADKKAEIMMDQEKEMDKNASFRSVITDQGSVESENSEVGEGSNEQFACEEDKHVTDIAGEVNELSIIDEVSEETIIVKECQILVDQVKEQVKVSPKLEKLEENPLVEEKSEAVMQVTPEEVSLVDEEEEAEVREEVREETPSKDANETPMKEEVKKERKHNLIKKKDVNARINPTRLAPKPNHVTTKPITNKIVTTKKTPPSKEIRSTITKKPASPGLSTPRVYKQPDPKVPSLSTSQSSVKKETASALLRNKQTAPKSLHISPSVNPSASDPTALASTRKSLIMERMGDKDIVKRAFKTFQKSFDLGSSVDGQNTTLKQDHAKATSIPSVATRQKENGRPTKASTMEKRSITNNQHSSSRGLKGNATADKQQKEVSKYGARPIEKTRFLKNTKAATSDAKTRRSSLKPKAKPMQGSLTVPEKDSLDKVL
ncbi:unnamed protein product [Cochlearia groenlandica]